MKISDYSEALTIIVSKIKEQFRKRDLQIAKLEKRVKELEQQLNDPWRISC